MAVYAEGLIPKQRAPAPLGASAQGGDNRSARRRCSFRRKPEEDIGAYDNAHYVVVQRKCHCFLVALALRRRT